MNNMDETWRPTCGEVNKKIFMDTYTSDVNLPAIFIEVGDPLIGANYATISNVNRITGRKPVRLTQELWVALLLARNKTSSGVNTSTFDENKKTGQFIMEYLKVTNKEE